MLIVLLADDTLDATSFLEKHSGEMTILILGTLILGTLMILVPQLLRHGQKTQEWIHAERMRSLEQGLPVQDEDVRSAAAGRSATLVPMVVVCAAGTVTCFLAGYRSENLFSVALAVWSVAGLISLACITGGVALMGRLAQLQQGDVEEPEEDYTEEPVEKE